MIVDLNTVWNSLVYSLCGSILHLDSTRHPAVATWCLVLCALLDRELSIFVALATKIVK